MFTFILHYGSFPLNVKKVTCLIEGILEKMLYHHTVVIKEWCDVARDFLSWSAFS